MDAERKPEELEIGGPVGTVEVRFFEVVSCWGSVGLAGRRAR
jgi:hypothetical protein